ncbi:hypothetical protein MMC09_006447 [Bachmanniomyces sp. S44760]|nr:hypothetical protein [Bachmanniomyces sp. S44760]
MSDSEGEDDDSPIIGQPPNYDTKLWGMKSETPTSMKRDLSLVCRPSSTAPVMKREASAPFNMQNTATSGAYLNSYPYPADQQIQVQNLRINHAPKSVGPGPFYPRGASNSRRASMYDLHTTVVLQQSPDDHAIQQLTTTSSPDTVNPNIQQLNSSPGSASEASAGPDSASSLESYPHQLIPSQYEVQSPYEMPPMHYRELMSAPASQHHPQSFSGNLSGVSMQQTPHYNTSLPGSLPLEFQMSPQDLSHQNQHNVQLEEQRQMQIQQQRQEQILAERQYEQRVMEQERQRLLEQEHNQRMQLAKERHKERQQQQMQLERERQQLLHLEQEQQHRMRLVQEQQEEQRHLEALHQQFQQQQQQQQQDDQHQQSQLHNQQQDVGQGYWEGNLPYQDPVLVPMDNDPYPAPQLITPIINGNSNWEVKQDEFDFMLPTRRLEHEQW